MKLMEERTTRTPKNKMGVNTGDSEGLEAPTLLWMSFVCTVRTSHVSFSIII